MSTNNKAEFNPHTFNQIGTTEGKVYFGDTMKNGSKMAVLIRNVFGSGTRDHYIGLQMDGKLAGSTMCRTPVSIQLPNQLLRSFPRLSLKMKSVNSN